MGRQAVDPQQYQRADDGGDDTGTAAARAVPPQRTPEKPGHQRTGDTEQHRDDDAPWILAWHDQLRQGTHDQPYDQRPDNVHDVPSALNLGSVLIDTRGTTISCFLTPFGQISAIAPRRAAPRERFGAASHGRA